MIYELTIILLILFAAGLVQGASSCGFGLVAVTLLSFAMNIKDASVGLVLVSMPVNIFIFWRLRASFRFERITPLMISSLFGVPLGVLVLIKADEDMLKRILGMILIIAVVQGILPKLMHKRWHPLWLGIPCGLFSGALAGAFAAGGPPVIAYLSTQKFNHLRYAASVQFVLGSAGIIRLLVLGMNNSISTELLYLSVAGATAACLGAFIGLKILKAINQDIFRKLVLLILTIMAIIYLSR